MLRADGRASQSRRLRVHLLRHARRQLHLQNGSTQGGRFSSETSPGILPKFATEPSHPATQVFRLLLLQLQRQKCSSGHHEQSPALRHSNASQVRPERLHMQTKS